MDLMAAAETISSRIGAFDGLEEDARPDHVLVRAALIVGDEDLAYVDDDVSRTPDSAGWSGDIVIFTPTRVVRLTLSHATGDADEQVSASSAQASSWRRADLRAVALLGPDRAWEVAPEAGMRERTGLRLTYADGQVIEIPSRWEAGAGRAERDGVFELLPSLWSDLAAGS
jgi:hypothetical protein